MKISKETKHKHKILCFVYSMRRNNTNNADNDDDHITDAYYAQKYMTKFAVER